MITWQREKEEEREIKKKDTRVELGEVSNA